MKEIKEWLVLWMMVIYYEYILSLCVKGIGGENKVFSWKIYYDFDDYYC